VGVLTMPNRRERHGIVRMAYALQPAPVAPTGVVCVDVRFVFCNMTDLVGAALVAIEARRHGDVLVLDCTENMNDDREDNKLESWLGEARRCRKSAFHQRNKDSRHNSVRVG
jgi:hypothetical protein